MQADSLLPARLRPRLLVVDDVAENRDILCRRFQRRGYATVEAACGPTALELIAQQAFDLVLLDIEMPGMDGLQVLEQIRGRDPGSDLRVIMVTGRTQQVDVMAAVAGSANDYVTKPVDFQSALARVEAQLRSREQKALDDPSTTALFTFHDPRTSLPPHPLMGVAPEKLVTGILSTDLLLQKLGVCARYTDPGGGAFVGVWGERNVERFHALLESRWSKLVVVRERPPAAQLEWRRTAAAAA